MSASLILVALQVIAGIVALCQRLLPSKDYAAGQAVQVAKTDDQVLADKEKLDAVPLPDPGTLSDSLRDGSF